MPDRRFNVPSGRLGSDDEAARRRRLELREQLLRGEQVVITQSGEVKDADDASPSDAPAIRVPPGKLAASFHWYERDADLFREEQVAMSRFFPQFQHEKLSDGRLAWSGLLRPDNLREGAKWYLQAVYENNHPDRSSYGGSIKVYSISPDLDEMFSKLGGIPHVLRDSKGHIYICTSFPNDFHASVTHSTSAASAVSWAAKWIAAFELWMAGELSTADFAGHRI